MAKFIVVSASGEELFVEADNFEISGQWVLFTSVKESLVDVDPIPKTAFVAACKDVFFFQAIDDEHNPVQLVR